MSVLPALVTSLVLATSPAMRYSSSLRAETFVRTENLTEQSNATVLADFVITPRGQVIFYTPRMEVKAILEPQLLLRRTFDQPTLEVLTFLFLRGEYRLTRGVKVWALESLTYGSFPFEDFRFPQRTSETEDGPGVRQLDASQYMYSEALVGVDFLGIRRTYIGIMGGLVFNGLLDPPTTVSPVRNRSTPAQIGPELRALAFHSVTRRFTLGVHLYGRDVNFSTGAHLSLLQALPVFQYQFHPQIEGRLEAGVAVGERRPQRTARFLPTESILHPAGELSIKTPVPLGYHWPVKAKLAARYVPHVNPFTTAVYPRMEGAFAFEWKGRREAQINLELAVAQARVEGFHRRDGEERISAKVQWPLTRTTAVVASGRLLRLREFLIDDEPIYKWFVGAGIVIRQENGRL
jgi:hypothetical protein